MTANEQRMRGPEMPDYPFADALASSSAALSAEDCEHFRREGCAALPEGREPVPLIRSMPLISHHRRGAAPSSSTLVCDGAMLVECGRD